MSGNAVADIIGGTLVGLIVLWLIAKAWGTRRARRTSRPGAPSAVAHKPAPSPAPRTEARPPSGARGAYRAGRITDRRSLWALRYGAGGGLPAAAWTAGAGLHLTQKDGVGDPDARCSGSPGMMGGNCRAGGACGGGVGCGGGGGGCGGGCGGGS